LAFILPVKLLKMVEYGMESEDFRFFPHRNPGTRMYHYIHDILLIPHPPKAPPRVGGWGVALGGGV
jgi:hypothetical protein